MASRRKKKGGRRPTPEQILRRDAERRRAEMNNALAAIRQVVSMANGEFIDDPVLREEFVARVKERLSETRSPVLDPAKETTG